MLTISPTRFIGLIPIIVLTSTAWLTALHSAEPAPDDAAPAYEPITLSTWYVVDPGWPKRPDHCKWHQTPGVAVEDKDQVWVFTRGIPPVQVYDSEGDFVRAWGTDLIGSKDIRKISNYRSRKSASELLDILQGVLDTGR